MGRLAVEPDAQTPEQLTNGDGFGPDDIHDFADGRAFQTGKDCPNQIRDMDGLNALLTPFDNRYPGQTGQPQKQRPARRAASVDDGRTQDGPFQTGCAKNLVGGSLAEVVCRSGIGVSTQGGYLNDPFDAGLLAGFEQCGRSLVVQIRKTLLPGLAKDAHGIDDRIDTGKAGEPDIRRHIPTEVGQYALATGRMVCPVRWTADAKRHAMPRRQQGMDEMVANESTGAGDKNMHAATPDSVPVSVVLRGHRKVGM